MNNEQDIIKAYDEAYEKYQEAGDRLDAWFRAKHKEEIDNAKTKKDFDKIKEQLRVMPDSVEKTLLFRTLILLEDERTKI